MTDGISIDTHEPLRVHKLLSQAVSASLLNLNDSRWADYRWVDCDGEYVHVERKQWAELTSGLDSIEVQLREEKQAHPEARLILLVEGVATPSFMGTQLYHASKNGKREVFYAKREQATRYSQVQAWLYAVGKHLEVVQTSTLEGTVQALVAMYQNDQKEEHSTFARHLRSISWQPNPQTEMLMAVGRGIGIGEAKAKELIAQYGTLHRILTADPKELAQAKGVGMHLATKILRKVGRTDV